MTNLHDARVNAAAKAIADTHNEGQFERYREGWVEEARRALAAADAVVTVEMIADTAHKAMQDSWTDSEEYEHAPTYIAHAVLALIRGGEEQ